GFGAPGSRVWSAGGGRSGADSCCAVVSYAGYADADADESPGISGGHRVGQRIDPSSTHNAAPTSSTAIHWLPAKVNSSTASSSCSRPNSTITSRDTA